MTVSAFAVGCGSDPSVMSTVTHSSFGVTPSGRAVEAFQLSNQNGIEVVAITYGGIITSIRTPDRDGIRGRRYSQFLGVGS